MTTPAASSSPDASEALTQRRALAVLAALAAFAASLVLVPSAISMLLASWVAILTRPWMAWLTRWLRGRSNASAAITTVIVIALLGPVVFAIVPVVISAVHLAREVGRSQQWHDAAQIVIGGTGATDVDVLQLIRSQAANAWAAVAMVLRTSATVLFGLAMFIAGLFAFAAYGDAIYLWLRRHSPLAPKHFERLAGAYADAGRGLVVGVGATALIQGALATMMYLVVGLPRALSLGLLTTMGALIPGVGTMIVWGPITVILAMGGYPGKAAAVAIVSAVLISSVDNFLKPVLSSRARLRLPPVLVFVTMLSGLAAFGPTGLVLGPLFVSMAIELLAIARDEGLVGVGADASTEPKPASGGAEPPPEEK